MKAFNKKIEQTMANGHSLNISCWNIKQSLLCSRLLAKLTRKNHVSVIESTVWPWFKHSNSNYATKNLDKRQEIKKNMLPEFNSAFLAFSKQHNHPHHGKQRLRSCFPRYHSHNTDPLHAPLHIITLYITLPPNKTSSQAHISF